MVGVLQTPALTSWLRRRSKRKTGFEPATLSLARRCSTTEPLPHLQCRGPELNWRPYGFQPHALPSELPRHAVVPLFYTISLFLSNSARWRLAQRMPRRLATKSHRIVLPIFLCASVWFCGFPRHHLRIAAQAQALGDLPRRWPLAILQGGLFDENHRTSIGADGPCPK